MVNPGRSHVNDAETSLPDHAAVASVRVVSGQSPSAGLIVIGILSGVGVVTITAWSFWLGIKALGTPSDRRAGNATLQQVAVLLEGRFRERREYKYLVRPAQYGGIDGRLGDYEYEVFLLPWNTEDHGGCAMLLIGSRDGRPLDGKNPRALMYTPEKVWHWPDLADPRVLADYVRQAVATLEAGRRRQDLPSDSDT